MTLKTLSPKKLIKTSRNLFKRQKKSKTVINDDLTFITANLIFDSSICLNDNAYDIDHCLAMEGAIEGISYAVAP